MDADHLHRCPTFPDSSLCDRYWRAQDIHCVLDFAAFTFLFIVFSLCGAVVTIVLTRQLEIYIYIYTHTYIYTYGSKYDPFWATISFKEKHES